MYSRYIKFGLVAVLLALTVWLFAIGWIGTAIIAIFVNLVVGLTLWRSEHVLIAIYYMRKQKMDKAAASIDRIKHPEALPQRQEAYVYYLKGVVGAQSLSMGKTEALFKKALSLGLKQEVDRAICKMNLGAIAMQRRRKREAMNYLAEAKKLDKNGLLDEQLKMLKKQMGRI